VHVVARAGTPLWAVSEYSRMTAVERLRGLGVQLWTSADVRFADGTATVTSTLVSTSTSVAVTDVVVLDPPTAEDGLVAPLLDAGVPVHVVGDAVAPRSLLEAMAEGHALGRAL
jgi:hypothetical protein